MCRLKLLNGVAIEFCLIFSVCTCNMVYSVSSLLRALCKKVLISNLLACLLSKKKSNQRPTIVIRIKQVLSPKEDRKYLLKILLPLKETFSFQYQFHFYLKFILFRAKSLFMNQFFFFSPNQNTLVQMKQFNFS